MLKFAKKQNKKDFLTKIVPESILEEMKKRDPEF